MKMKKQLMAVIAASLISSQVVMADESLTSTQDMSELAFAFEKSTTLNHAPLSHVEMVETEGERWQPWISAASGIGNKTRYVKSILGGAAGGISKKIGYVKPALGGAAYAFGTKLAASILRNTAYRLDTATALGGAKASPAYRY